jgi:AcrR family transcriptional regulator
MRRVLTTSTLEQFQNRICVVATELLAELGHDGFNMRELANRLGVSTMTAYRYYDSKTEILSAVRLRAFHALADRLEAAPDLESPTTERLVAVCRTYADFVREEPIRYRLMFDLLQPRGPRSAELAGAERRVLQAFAGHGGIPERAAKNLWASLHGIFSLTLTEILQEAEMEGLIAQVVRDFSGSDDRPAEFAHELQLSGKERHVPGAERANGASAQGWIPLTAAE